MGVMESGCFSVYSLCRYTSKFRCSYIASQICELRFMDSRADGSKLSLVVQTHFRFSILVLISLLTLLFSLFVFRASSNGEISGPQSFGNVIFKMIFVVLRQIRTIQKYYRFNKNTIFSPRFHASVIMNAPACQIVLSTNCINSLTSLIQPVLYYKAYV